MSRLIVIIGIIEVDHKIGVLAAIYIDRDETSLIICTLVMEAILDL